MFKAYVLAGVMILILRYFIPITPGEALILLFMLAHQYRADWPTKIKLVDLSKIK